MSVVDEAEERITLIKEVMQNAEVAHVREDEMWNWALKLVVARHPLAVAVAEVALGTSEIDFERWYA